MKKSAVVIGPGLIGAKLISRLKATGWHIPAIVKRDKICNEQGEPMREFDGNIEQFFDTDAGLVFLCIPSTNGGTVASDYIHDSLEAGLSVVTCEKGALSHHFRKFSSEIDRIGYSATVGGGTRLLPTLKEHLHGRQDVITHAVVNGTLNFLFHSMQYDGDSLNAAVRKAVHLGYAEPGAKSDLDIVNGEMRDTVMKTVILVNTCAGMDVHASEISVQELDSSQLRQLTREVAVRRYLVSVYPPSYAVEDDDVIGGFRHEVAGWLLRGGFHRIDQDPIFANRLPAGVNNGVITVEGPGGEDGIYVLANGPGAGAEATTSAMLGDARKLLAL